MCNPDRQDLLDEIAVLSKNLDIPEIALSPSQNMIGGGSTPPNAPLAMVEDSDTVSIPQQGMEPLGYLCLRGSNPDPVGVNQLMEAFDVAQKIEKGSTIHAEGAPESYSVLQSGIWNSDDADPVSDLPLSTAYTLSAFRSCDLSKACSVLIA